VPSYPESSSPRARMLDPEDEGVVILLNVGELLTQ